MAIVKFVASGCPMNNIFPYVMNWGKTDENLISGINCSPDTALQEFTFVKKQFKKEDGRTYVHIVQAFSPDDDITPDTGFRTPDGDYQRSIDKHLTRLSFVKVTENETSLTRKYSVGSMNYTVRSVFPRADKPTIEDSLKHLMTREVENVS